MRQALTAGDFTATARWEGSASGAEDALVDDCNVVQGSHYIVGVRFAALAGSAARESEGLQGRHGLYRRLWDGTAYAVDDVFLGIRSAPDAIAYRSACAFSPIRFGAAGPFSLPLDGHTVWDVRWTDLHYVAEPGSSCGSEVDAPSMSCLLESMLEMPYSVMCDADSEKVVPGPRPRPTPAGLLLGPAVLPLQVAFWNARGFLMQVGLHSKPRRKHSCFSALMGEAGIVVAEAHGHAGDLATIRAEHPRSYVAGSFMQHAGAGGIFVVVHERVTRATTAPVSFAVLDPGRTVQLRLTFGDASLRLIFVHLNPSLSLGLRRRAVRRLCTWAAAGAGERVIVMGDLNIRSSTEPIWRADGPPELTATTWTTYSAEVCQDSLRFCPMARPTECGETAGWCQPRSSTESSLTSLSLTSWTLPPGSTARTRSSDPGSLRTMCRFFCTSGRYSVAERRDAYRVGLCRARTSASGSSRFWQMKATEMIP